MVYIEKQIIKDQNSVPNCQLQYPKIKNNDSNFIENINKSIYEDVVTFRDVSIELGKSSQKIITEYEVAYNDNNILSIFIDFTQLNDLFEITYTKSYNYDLNLEKELSIKDMFYEKTDYIQLIEKEIKNQINNNLIGYPVIDFMETIINPTFYIEKNSLTICFNSYELSEEYQLPIEFKIDFQRYKRHLSNYILLNICRPY